MRENVPWVVLEFGEGDIRVCRSEEKKGERRITDCRVVPLGEDAARVLSRLGRSLCGRWRPSRFILSLPRQEASVRVIRLPSTDERETDSMVTWHARREPALTGKDILIAHRVVGRDKEGWARVIVYGVARSKVMERLRVLDRAGMSVDVVTLETQGVVDWTRGGASIEALIHAEGEAFEWSVAQEGVSIFSRSFRASCAGAGAGDALLRELSLSHGVFRQWYPDLASGSIPLNALGVLSARHMEALRPRLNGRGDRDLLIFDGERGHAPRSLIPVIGLALKGSKDPIDVTPPEWRQQLKTRHRRWAVRRWSLAGLMCFVLLCVYGLFSVKRAAVRWESAQAAARVLSPWSEKMARRVAWERSVSDEPVVDMWDRLAHIAAPDVYLTEFVADKTGVKISGWAPQASHIIDLWERLKKEPGAAGFQLERVSEARGFDKERAIFRMAKRARKNL